MYLPSTFNFEEDVTLVAITLYSKASSTVHFLTISFFFVPLSIIVYFGDSRTSCPFLIINIV